MMSVCFGLNERRVEICIDVKNLIDDSFEEQDTDVVNIYWIQQDSF